MAVQDKEHNPSNTYLHRNSGVWVIAFHQETSIFGLLDILDTLAGPAQHYKERPQLFPVLHLEGLHVVAISVVRVCHQPVRNDAR